MSLALITVLGLVFAVVLLSAVLSWLRQGGKG